MDGAKIVVTNSMVKHSLVTSAYNDRRNESAQALKDLQTVCDIKTLGDRQMKSSRLIRMRLRMRLHVREASMRFMRTSVPSRLLRH